jgi:hypothetical protein
VLIGLYRDDVDVDVEIVSVNEPGMPVGDAAESALRLAFAPSSATEPHLLVRPVNFVVTP